MPKIRRKIFREQVNILHHNLLASIPANFICAAVVFSGLYFQHAENSRLVLGWFISVVFVSLLRFLGLFYYNQHLRSDLFNLYLFIIAMSLSAALWGVAGSILMPNDNLMKQVLIIVVIAGVTAGGIQTLNASLAASLIYVCLCVLPLSLWLFLQGGFIYTIIGVAMTTYLLFMLVTSVRSYRLLESSLTLRFENLSLIEDLSDSNKKLSQLREILYEQTIRDPLTGLYNRRYLDDFFNRELNLAVRENKALSVVMADLDNFKNINDKYGHEAGDAVLKSVSRLLKENMRVTDSTCRIGGDEFLLVLVDTELSAATQRLQRIRDIIKQEKIYFNNRLLPAITLSVGIAEAPAQGETVNEIIRVADEALYLAKQSGKNKMHFQDLVT